MYFWRFDAAHHLPFLFFFLFGTDVSIDQAERKTIMTNENNKIGTGSIMENFSLISYDEDSGRMLMRKEFDDGSVWLEPVAKTHFD